ncbi:cytochrome P450 [Circinella umbellata]|nr:cytochrome P450 [Circinella umbellata]
MLLYDLKNSVESLDITTRHIIFITSVTGILYWAFCKNSKRQKQDFYQQHQSTVSSLPGALPLVGHILELSQDPDSFIKKCKSKCGPIFRVQMPIINDLYVVTGNLIPELLSLPEKTASLHNVVEGLFPVEDVIYKHYREKRSEEETFISKHPAIPIGQRYLKGDTLYSFEGRVKQAMNEIFHTEMLGGLRPGETKQINYVAGLVERTLSYMFSLNFFGAELSLIDNKVLAQELVQVSRIMMRAAPVYHSLPYRIADKIVRTFLPSEKHLEAILDQVTPVVNGIRSGNIPDDETSFISMLMKHPASFYNGETDIRSASNTALQITRIFCLTKMTLVHTNSLMIYELAHRPELVQELREAIMKLDEKPTAKSLSQIPLMDSFIRELFRHKSHTFMHFRAAQKEIMLSTGQVIPEGSIMIAAVNDAQRDPEMTPMVSDVPLDQFDPYRYLKTMKKGENEDEDEERREQEQEWDPTRVNQPGYYPFGFRMRPCRGRFFVIQEMKLIIAEIVTNYNLKTTSDKNSENFLFGIARIPPKDSIIFERI